MSLLPTAPAVGLRVAACSLLLACSHVAPDAGLRADPRATAAELDQDLQLLVEGATTLHAEVQGVEVETRIALTDEDRAATWTQAVEAFDALQPHLALPAEEQLALEYRFSLLHQALEHDASEEAAELREALAPHLKRLEAPTVASR